MIQQSHSWAYIQRKLIQKDTCTPTFTVALFAIIKTWKQPKCLSTDEWIRTCVTYVQWNTRDSAIEKEYHLQQHRWT